MPFVILMHRASSSLCVSFNYRRNGGFALKEIVSMDWKDDVCVRYFTAHCVTDQSPCTVKNTAPDCSKSQDHSFWLVDSQPKALWMVTGWVTATVFSMNKWIEIKFIFYCLVKQLHGAHTQSFLAKGKQASINVEPCRVFGTSGCDLKGFDKMSQIL